MRRTRPQSMGSPYAAAVFRDLRERVVAAAAQQMQAEVAARFAVSESTVYKWCRRARETGSAAAKPHTGGGRPEGDAAGATVLRAVWRACRRLDLRREKEPRV